MVRATCPGLWVHTSVQDYGYILVIRIMHNLMHKGTIDGTIPKYYNKAIEAHKKGEVRKAIEAHKKRRSP